MFTLDQPVTFEQDIKKSRFIAFATPITGEDDARAFFAAHSDFGASHNCWAWRTGQIYRFSDDGEPSGTAGKPILQAIDGQELDNVAVLVIRWFGGILLGSGGLMRAYGGTAAACLRLGEKSPVIAYVTATLSCPFSDLALVKSRLSATRNLRIEKEDFTATGADMRLAVPVEETERLTQLLSDLTSGRVNLHIPD
ncbi:YigZ family protein [Agrobacterium tumefaciens]|uniref:IMPACT family protein n=1 Tax=Agrobacterium tumefaciens TaxID=358 RepID=UPI00287EF717|nr:YigZ family protein [Agrobacterium tumefaciens]MDS7595064.1 IMPACT family protein [Agrobacterium tumefaciens]